MLTKKPREYAKQYNVSLRTIQRYAAAGYPLDDPQAMAEKISQQKHQPGGHKGHQVPSKELKMKLECEKLAFNLAVAKGEYSSNAQVREEITGIATTLRAAFMRFESDLPGVLAGLDEVAIKKILHEKTDQLMAHLHEKSNYLAPPPDEES